MNIFMFWKGPVSVYEQACMRSFVLQGFELLVFTYDLKTKFPEGVQGCDAREILPEEMSTAYTQGGQKSSLASFSNRFRYKLLSEAGGIWADADILCLKPPQDLQQLLVPHAHQLIVARQDTQKINTAFMAAPVGHSLVQSLLQDVEQQGFVIEKWGMIGPDLLTKHVNQNPESTHIMAADTFYPIHYLEFAKLILPEYTAECEQLCKQSFGLHLWNEMFRNLGMPKNMLPPEGSFLHHHFVSLLGEIAPTLPVTTIKMLLQGVKAQQKLLRLKHTLAKQFNGILSAI